MQASEIKQSMARVSDSLLQEIEDAVRQGESIDAAIAAAQGRQSIDTSKHTGEYTGEFIPSNAVNLLTAGIDLAASIPPFSATQKQQIISPIMTAAENATALSWNQARHPSSSGISMERLSVALARYVDFASAEQAIRDFNTQNPDAAIEIQSQPDNAVLAEAIHQFQLKCYLETDQHDGLAGESVLDNLGLIERTGMQTVDRAYGPAQSRLNAASRSVERETNEEFTARNWFDNLVNPTFLGQRFSNGIHRIAIRKLRTVEQQFFNSTPDTTPVELGRRFGVIAGDKHRGMRFRGTGNHIFGLAFDLKYLGNPWIAGNPDRSVGNQYFEETMDRVARLMLGETGFAFTPRYLHNLTQRLTTTEIHAELTTRDEQLRTYLQLSDNADRLQQILEERQQQGTPGIFRTAGETVAEAQRRWQRQIQADNGALRSYFSPGRDPRNGFINLPLELVVALRDDACMAWGAVDFGPSQNGDIMHFDMRVTGVGSVLSRFSPSTHPCLPAESSDSKPTNSLLLPTEKIHTEEIESTARLDPARWVTIIRRSLSTASTLRIGNAVKFLIDGTQTFRAMVEAIRRTQNRTHYIYLLGWILKDQFELIPGDRGSTFRALMTAAARRGVQIRVMLWDQVGTQNSAEVRWVNSLSTGAAILDDETPKPIAAFGSHHQKVLVVKCADGLRTFCGGIDINEDRISVVTGGGSSGGTAGSPLHDSHCQIMGPAAYDLLQTFIRRWDHHPNGARLDRSKGALLGRREPIPRAIATPRSGTASSGASCAVAITRTFNPVTSGSRLPRERDIKNVLIAAIRNARKFIYMEEQYLIHLQAAAELRAAIPRIRHLTILIPASEISDLPCVWRYRGEFIRTLTAGLSARDRAKVRIFVLATPPMTTPPRFGRHTYVHAKSWVFDDELAVIGSANCNRRGWEHDSEVHAFIFEDAWPVRTSQTFAQKYRAQLWAEHLNVSPSAVADGVTSARLWLTPPRGAKVMPYNPTAGRDRLSARSCRVLRNRIDPTI